MIVGVPREIKQDEYRVGMLPVGVEELSQAGHRVLVERGAGMGSGIPDEQYAVHGAEIVAGASELYGEAELVVKVKEPLPSEWPLLRRGQLLFTYFHFAADEQLTRGVLETGVFGHCLRDTRRPARRPAVPDSHERSGRQDEHSGGGEVPGTSAGRSRHPAGRRSRRPRRRTLWFSAAESSGRMRRRLRPVFQADVVIMDINVDRLRYLEDIMPANVNTLFSDRHNIREQLRLADLVIGGVLIPGARAPRLVSESDLTLMKPGAVIIDVAVDQGGCFATSKPTTHSEPTYIVNGVVHYCVANMPGAVGRTSTYALCNVTFPYALRLANVGLESSVYAESGSCRRGEYAWWQGHEQTCGGHLRDGVHAAGECVARCPLSVGRCLDMTAVQLTTDNGPPTMTARIGILTVSDRASRGEYEDRGGPALLEYFGEVLTSPWEPIPRVIPDEQQTIENALIELCGTDGCCLVVTTGGTGPAQRDVTPEATEAVCQKMMPGFGELMRKVSLEKVPTAILSRQTAGIRGSTLIINLPGQPKAISECLDAVMPAVPYCVDLIGGPYLETNEERILAFRPGRK